MVVCEVGWEGGFQLIRGSGVSLMCFVTQWEFPLYCPASTLPVFSFDVSMMLSVIVVFPFFYSQLVEDWKNNSNRVHLSCSDPSQEPCQLWIYVMSENVLTCLSFKNPIFFFFQRWTVMQYQLEPWVAHMWPHRQTQLCLFLGSWLSQTSAGGQRSGLAFLCPNPSRVPTYPLSRGSTLPVTHRPVPFSGFAYQSSSLSERLLPFKWLLMLTLIIITFGFFPSCQFAQPFFSFFLFYIFCCWVDMPVGEPTPRF